MCRVVSQAENASSIPVAHTVGGATIYWSDTPLGVRPEGFDQSTEYVLSRNKGDRKEKQSGTLMFVGEQMSAETISARICSPSLKVDFLPN
jgi:hypothetical protein